MTHAESDDVWIPDKESAGRLWGRCTKRKELHSNGEVDSAGNGAPGLGILLPTVRICIHRDREAWDVLEQKRNEITVEP